MSQAPRGTRRTPPTGETVDDLLASSTTGFSCKMCGSCCSLDVRVTESDRKRIESHYPDQAERTRRMRRDGPVQEGGLYSPLFARASLRAQCIFLEGNRCSIHEEKPLQCRLYPFFPIQVNSIEDFISDPRRVATIESPSGARYVVSVDQDCRGISRLTSNMDWGELVRLWEQHERECGETTR